MRQLTSLDNQFLALENSRQSGHVGGVAVLDPSTTPSGTLTAADLEALLVERLPMLPPLRWRLAPVPLGLDYPYWVAEQVARIMSRPLDRARPLWELYLIHGLRHGQLAMLTKIHHAVIDGISGSEIMGLLLDLGPDGPLRPQEREWKGPPETMPGTGEMLARAALGVPRYPLRLLRALPRAMPNVQDTPFGVLPGAAIAGGLTTRVRRLLGGTTVAPGQQRFTAPRTSFNGRISPHRRFAFGQLSLDEVKAIKNHHHCTVNDAIVEALSDVKERHKALPATLLQDANHFIPPAVFHRAAQLTFRLSSSGAAHPTWNLVISNVPGPRIRLYCAGARLVANYPVSVITDGMGLNITVTSYLDNLDVGIIADRDQMPDVNRLVAWLKDGVAELLPPDDKAEPTEGKVQRVATSAQRRRSAPG